MTACLGSYHYERPKAAKERISIDFRLALCDFEALERSQEYLRQCRVETSEFDFCRGQRATGRQHACASARIARSKVEEVRGVIAWPAAPTREWHAGFLAGFFDAEGSYSCSACLRMSNTDREIIAWLERSLREFGFRLCHRAHPPHALPSRSTWCDSPGGLVEHLRFFHTVDPAITRKRDISGQAVKSHGATRSRRHRASRQGHAALRHHHRNRRLHRQWRHQPQLLRSPQPRLRRSLPRPRFRNQALLQSRRRQTARSRARGAEAISCSPIMLGANTDPYQPLEKTLKVTRSILEVLLRCKHPVNVTTKGALVARDVDLLAELARDGLTRVMFSIPTLDDDMKRILEPRAAPRPRRSSRPCACWRMPGSRWGCWSRPSSRCSPNMKSNQCSRPHARPVRRWRATPCCDCPGR